MKTFLQMIAAICLTTFLAACGGGGGGEPAATVPVTSNDTFQLKTAYVNYLNDTRSLPFTVSGKAEGVSVTGSGTVTQSSLTNTVFEGITALQKVVSVSGSLVANGTPLALPPTTLTSYVDSNDQPLGSSGTEYTVVIGAVNIPVTGKVNDSGLWFTENRYPTSAKTPFLGTNESSFQLQPDTASTALLKIIQTEKDTLGTVTMLTTLTFRITPAGAITRISETSVDEPMVNLTLTY